MLLEILEREAAYGRYFKIDSMIKLSSNRDLCKVIQTKHNPCQLN